MKIVVLKFGGTSVGNIDRIKKVSDIIINYIKKKYKVIVVSSAMSGATNDLVNKSKSISNKQITTTRWKNIVRTEEDKRNERNETKRTK